MKQQLFTGSATALVTPFDRYGEIDFSAYARLLDMQLAAGVDALVVNGTTGEAATLTDREKDKALRFVVDYVNGQVPVIAGTGSNSTAHAALLCQQAEAAGADGLLVVTPYYNKTTPAGLPAHYGTLSADTSLPIIVYNVPGRTGMTVGPDGYKALAAIPNVVAVKEASGDMSAIGKAMAAAGDSLGFYSGNDDQIVPIMSLGGLGVISVLGNIAPAVCRTMCALWRSGDTQGAARLQLQYLPVINALFAEVNPIPVKAALRRMGYAVGQCRLPLSIPDEEKERALWGHMAALGLL